MERRKSVAIKTCNILKLGFWGDTRPIILGNFIKNLYYTDETSQLNMTDLDFLQRKACIHEESCKTNIVHYEVNLKLVVIEG